MLPADFSVVSCMTLNSLVIKFKNDLFSDNYTRSRNVLSHKALVMGPYWCNIIVLAFMIL